MNEKSLKERLITRLIYHLTPFKEEGCDPVKIMVEPTTHNLVLTFLYSVNNLLSKPTSLMSRWLLADLKPRVFRLANNLLSETELEILRRIVEKMDRPNMKGLEIGSWSGSSTKVLAGHFKKTGGKLFCVDIWGTEKQPENLFQKRVALFDIFSIFMDNIKGLPVAPLIMNSNNIKIFKDETFDFIFIDGDHRYSQVSKDIRSSLKKLKPGGIIAGHDCDLKMSKIDRDVVEEHCEKDYVVWNNRVVHCGVVKAVDEAFKDYSLEESIWYTQKK